MKYPYVVPPTAREAYATSNVMMNSVAEAPRTIIAENLEWDDDITPPPLVHWATLSLSSAFQIVNPLPKILPVDIDMLLDMYPADIPLKYSVPLIKGEQYWKRSFYTKFPEQVELGVKYWKGRYLSACLQEYLETMNPNVFVAEEGAEFAQLVSHYVDELKLNQLRICYQPKPPVPFPDVVEDCCIYSIPKLYNHVALEPVLAQLYKLQELSLVFGVNNLAEKYETRVFEFSVEDCESLCKGLQNLTQLKTFRINRSNLDCIKVKTILENLVKIESIEELDFNHCKIGDYGMKALGGFIHVHPNVKRIRVVNNRFHEIGVQGISYALQMKPAAPLELLDFSLNTLTLECATMFAAAFVRCKEKPQTLIMNSCGLRGASAEKVTGILSLNRGLTTLCLAANDLSGDAEVTLIKSLERNKNIINIDLRRANVSDEALAKVAELLQRNKDLLGVDREPSDEIPPLYLNEPEYLVWEYHPDNPKHVPGRYPPRVLEL